MFLCVLLSLNAFSQTTIDYEDFQGGWGIWNDGGNDCRRDNYGLPNASNRSVRLRDNSGTASSMTTDDIDLTPYTSVDFTFEFETNSMETGEDFWVQYSDDGGASWTTIADYNRGTEFNNGTFYNPTLSIDTGSYTFSTNSQFRIRCDASKNDDEVFIDNILIEGYTVAAPIIDVVGNGTTMTDGQTAISVGDDTDFGAVLVSSGFITHTFTIENNGTLDLNTINVSLSGDTGDFTLDTSLTATTVLAGGFTTFTITFDPTIIGTRIVEVSITSNDTDRSPYTFNIEGEGIEPTYCISYGDTVYDTGVTLVNFNTINNASDISLNQYSDFTAISTTVGQTLSYDLTINLNTDGDYTIYARVWIDWNQDFDFDDPGEEYDLGFSDDTPDGPTSLSPFSITVPVGAALGDTRMRVSAKWNNYPTNCETNFDGEVEDYTITVITNTPKIDFDGVDDYVDFGDNHDLISSISIEAWILQENTVSNGTIVFKGDINSSNASKNYGYSLSVQNEYINFTTYNNGGNDQINITSSDPITNNRWYHIAVTYDGTTAVLYIDGIERGSDTSTSKPGDRAESFFIGAAYDSDDTEPINYFDGFIDEVRIWDVGLSETQLHEMMYQEIQSNGTAVQGKIIPLDISEGLLWANLIGYYDMNGDDSTDSSDSPVDGTSYNITTSQDQTAPLPYETSSAGDWSNTATWLHGGVWDIADEVNNKDWSIIHVQHDLTTSETHTNLGLVVDSGAELSIQSDQGLFNTWYLKLDGAIDLEGESQLIQTETSYLATSSAGYIERDQQGTANSFTYNYWCAPVSLVNITENNKAFYINDILLDGTIPDDATRSISFGSNTDPYYSDGAITPGDPIKITSYWLYKFVNSANEYSNWYWLGKDNTTLNAGDGFTMKGVSGLSAVSDEQNYVYLGKPNNAPVTLGSLGGDLIHTTFGGAFDGNGNPFTTLTGNPFPSALDADAFITDNIGGGTDAITGTLYFWEHWGGGTHRYSGYQGGYAIYTFAGGVAATSAPGVSDIGSGTKTPGQFIPVGQGFYIIQAHDDDGLGNLSNPSSGSVVFKNSQRVFEIEFGNSESIFVKKDTKKGNDPKGETIPIEKKRIWLGFDSSDGYHRQILAAFVDGATDAIDRGYDGIAADFLGNDAFFIQDDQYLVIQALGRYTRDREIPISVFVDEANGGKVQTFMIDNLDGFSETDKIYIKDKYNNNETHDISDETYEVALESGEHKDRFSLVFKSKFVKLKEIPLSQIDKNIKIFMNNKASELNIEKQTADIEITEVVLYNYIGQRIAFWEDGLQLESIQLPVNASPGAYILTVKTKEGTISKKIIIK